MFFNNWVISWLFQYKTKIRQIHVLINFTEIQFDKLHETGILAGLIFILQNNS